MLRFCIFFAFSLVTFADKSDVLDFTDSDFIDGVKPHEIILVEFYAPWCGHCKALTPEYEKAATILLSNDPPIHLAKVDCTVEKSICDKYGVSGFPALKIFRNGDLSQDYVGPRNAPGIVKYMQGQVGPSSMELISLTDFDKFISTTDHCIIGYFESDSKLKDSYQKVADIERDRFRFAHTSNADIIEKTTHTDDIVIYSPKHLHNKFELDFVKYDGNYDTDKIKKFITGEMYNQHGLVGVRTSDNTWQFDKKPLLVVYLNVDYQKDPKGTNYWRNRVMKVAAEFKRKVFFAISNKDDFSQEIDDYGLEDKKESTKPIVAAQTTSGKFPMNDEFSVENLQTFVTSLLANSLEPFMKSEPVPETQGNVKVVVAKNYKELIEDADQDILIEFYAPWCGHCKKLEPIFDELGEKMAGEKVIIAKMDATANDVPPVYTVTGFPTLYWVGKDAKTSPEPYQGGRDLDDLVKFIAKQSTDGLKWFSRNGKAKKAEL